MSETPGNNSDTPRYSRIRWQNGGLFSRASLWLAGDHVLQITSSGVQENYQRFYLRDIKAFMVRDARAWALWSALGGFVMFLFGLGVLLRLVNPKLDNGAMLLMCVLFAIASVFTLCAVWRARSVRFYAVTGLQTVLWRPVARKWQAEKLLAQLSPLIAAAQSGLLLPQPQPPPEEQAAP